MWATRVSNSVAVTIADYTDDLPNGPYCQTNLPMMFSAYIRPTTTFAELKQVWEATANRNMQHTMNSVNQNAFMPQGSVTMSIQGFESKGAMVSLDAVVSRHLKKGESCTVFYEQLHQTSGRVSTGNGGTCCTIL
jgi:hypothetical protein